MLKFPTTASYNIENNILFTCKNNDCFLSLIKEMNLYISFVMQAVIFLRPLLFCVWVEEKLLNWQLAQNWNFSHFHHDVNRGSGDVLVTSCLHAARMLSSKCSEHVAVQVGWKRWCLNHVLSQNMHSSWRAHGSEALVRTRHSCLCFVYMLLELVLWELSTVWVLTQLWLLSRRLQQIF